MKIDIKAIGKALLAKTKKNSSTILTALGITGFVSAVVVTAKVAPKAHEALLNNKEEIDSIESKPKKILKCVKTVAPYYAVPAVMCVTSGTAIIFAHKISSKRQAMAISAYTASQEALKTYQEKVIEKIGEKKEAKIQEEIKQDKISKGEQPSEQIVTVNDDKILCKDLYSGAFFRSTPDEIRKAEGRIKARLVNDEFITINEFYTYLDIPRTRAGEDRGWNIGVSNPQSDSCELIEFISEFAPDGVTPVLGIDFKDVGNRVDYYGW